ncbi:MAG: hypothetical protein JHC95_11775 [Solirubrobacteraceae bacterium]|nr:hypothetical protein [Solirubrobacteraceae bacterium]
MSSTPPQARSVKISDDERGGWSSDRPRREGSGPPREKDISVRNRVLDPGFRLRYSPGSLLLIASGSTAQAEAFAARVLEDRGALLSLGKVRTLLTGKVAAEELDAKAAQLLDAAITKRLNAGDSTVVVLATVDADERAPIIRAAAELRRPRHIILLEAPKEDVSDEDRITLNELRTALDAGDLGEEGIQTALRLGGATIADTKKIVFRPPPADD